MSNSGKFLFARFSAEKTLGIILEKIYACNQQMIDDLQNSNERLPNNENEIRDHLLYKYLSNSKVRDSLNLKQFLFIPEVPENKKKEEKRGRTDIRVLLKARSFDNPEEYFTIECKRIDGSNDLNKKFIENGIARFIDDSQPLYLSIFNINSLIGFVVESIDVNENIEKLNILMREYSSLNTSTSITQIDNSISSLYYSEHTSQNENLTLKHLMLEMHSVIA